MATTSQNNVDRTNRNQTSRQVVVTTDQTINAGDLCYWDSTNYTLKPLSATTQIQNWFFGMALQANAGLIYPGDADQPGILVMVRGTVFVNSTAGETYNHFQAVTIGADAQTVTKAGVTVANTLGWVWIDPPVVGSPRAFLATPVPETVGGAAAARITIQLNPQFVVAAAI
jgi:hypothetical protein